jgi:hypothetical protein
MQILTIPHRAVQGRDTIMTSRSSRFPATALLAGLLLAVPWLAPAGARATESRSLTLDVTDERPLAAVVRELERRHGAVITYEDPLLAAAAEAATAPGHQRLRPSRLALSYTVSAASGQPDDMAAVVQTAIDQYAAAGNPGRFRLEQDGTVLHVIPVEVIGSGDRSLPGNTYLDTRIDLPATERSLAATFELIVNAVSRATGLKVVITEEPLNRAARTPLRLGAAGESARRLLTRASSVLGPGSSWRSFFDPRSGAVALQIYDVHDH